MNSPDTPVFMECSKHKMRYFPDHVDSTSSYALEGVYIVFQMQYPATEEFCSGNWSDTVCLENIALTSIEFQRPISNKLK